jgi:hydrogenase/urease accessory protein HupE
MRRALLLALAFAVAAGAASAHEVRPAYLELRQTGPQIYDVLWKVPARGEDQRFGLYARLPEGCADATPRRGSMAGRAFLERWTVACAGGLAGGTVRIDGLSSTLTDVLARVERTDGTTQVARLMPASPSFVVEAAPSSAQAAVTYLRLGIEHILLGFDHLLFVFALVLIVSGGRTLVMTITAFTVAHSVTLTLATLGVVHAPGPPVEATIALSILLLACEIVRLQRGQPGLTASRPWLVAFSFGLLHGCGFAGALTEIGLPRGDVPLALLAFNVGVELGQLAFIAVVLGVLTLVTRVELPPVVGRRAVTTAAYAIGTSAAFWFFERLAGFGT